MHKTGASVPLTPPYSWTFSEMQQQTSGLDQVDFMPLPRNGNGHLAFAPVHT